jgi:tetratricopeptide (TPR) repeat protein
VGDRAGAREALEQARAIYEEKYAARSPEHADALVGLGRIDLEEGRSEAALARFEEAADYWAALGPDSRWAGEARFWLGRACAAVGRLEEAESHGRRAAEILSRSPLPSDAALLGRSATR